MKVAVIGAGFSGLAAAHYLVERGSEVTVIDKAPVGENTSAAASGLVHPYPGFMARPSLFASSAIEKTRELLKFAGEEVYAGGPLLRIAIDERQEEAMQKHVKSGTDVERCMQLPEWIAPDKRGYLIHSGLTVFSEKYLKALREKIKAEFIHGEVEDLAELSGYDAVVVATGGAMRQLFNVEGFRRIKGQALVCKSNATRSVLGRGYLAETEEEGRFHLGSTYEHHFESESPDLEVAKSSILRDAEQYLQCSLDVVGVKAGTRFAKRSSHLPYCKKVGEKAWALTAMGSRGLLYHAFLGDLLAETITSGEDCIPKEFQLE